MALAPVQVMNCLLIAQQSTLPVHTHDTQHAPWNAPPAHNPVSCSGLTDQQREDPPDIGCIIAYKCQEMTDGGVPRFPVFLGTCADKTCATDPLVRAAEAE